MFRAVFWVVLPCKMIVDHGSTTQKTALIIILAAVRTWNLTQVVMLRKNKVLHYSATELLMGVFQRQCERLHLTDYVTFLFWLLRILCGRFQVLTVASMKVESSGMYCRVVKYMLSDVSEVYTASIIRAITHRPDDGGSINFWNFGQHLLDYTVVHPIRLQTSCIALERGVFLWRNDVPEVLSQKDASWNLFSWHWYN
jgi:hypothetical protein